MIVLPTDRPKLISDEYRPCFCIVVLLWESLEINSQELNCGGIFFIEKYQTQIFKRGTPIPLLSERTTYVTSIDLLLILLFSDLTRPENSQSENSSSVALFIKCSSFCK